MYRLNKKIRELEPYKPISGSYKIRLDANESCFNMPQDMLSEILKSVENTAFNRYPDPTAKRLVKAFADYYGISADYVTAGNGSDELISVLMMSFLMRGDKIVTVAPDFSMYSFYASICEAECITYKKRDDLTIDVDELIKTVNESKAAMLIFSNPCNPTSKGLTIDEIKRLIRSVDTLVVLDEAYMDFWEQSLLKEIHEFDNLIILRTASKAVGAAAIRLGFAVANPTLTKAIRAVKSPYNVNSLTQSIGTIVFENKEYLSKARDEIIRLREQLADGLKRLEQRYPDKMKIIDGNSNFVFIRTDLGRRIYEYLLARSIAIRFMGDYIRITAGTHQENTEVLMCLNDFFVSEDI